MKKLLSIIIMVCMFMTMSFATTDRVSAESIEGSMPADEVAAAEETIGAEDTASAGENAATEESAAADESTATDDAAVYEEITASAAADNVVSANGSVTAKGSMKAMAATSPSGAEKLTAGQWKSGRFTYTKVTYGNGVPNGTYMENTSHYYKIRTGSKAGATYTLKAEYTAFSGNRDSYGIAIRLLDSNYNEVRFDEGSKTWAFTDMHLMLSEAGSMTYSNLKQNADYYVEVESNSGYDRDAIDYKVCYTSSDNSGSTTPTLVTPTVTLDKTRITATDANNVYVTGKVSYACSQNVGVFDASGKVPYNYVTLGNSKRSETFSIKIPSAYLSKGTNNFKVVSMPVRNVVNSSKMVDLTVEIGQTHSTWYPVYKTTVNGSVYEILQNKEIGGPAARLVKAKNAKRVTIPATVKFKGVHYNVTGIQPNAFKSSKAKTVTIKTRMLSKGSVKKSLSGSKVKTIKVSTVNKKLSKSFVKKYKKFFTKSNCGKKVKVKR